MRVNVSSCQRRSSLAALLISLKIFVIGCSGSTNQSVPPSSKPVPSVPESSSISPELIQKVKDLVRLNKEWIAIAETIKTSDDFENNSDALSRIDQEGDPLVEALNAAMESFSPSQKAEFESKYYEGLAKPSLLEVRRQRERLAALPP
jgi:hypothetical protein